MYLAIVDETGSCSLLIMLGDGPRYKELGEECLSAYFSATTGNISDTIFFFFFFFFFLPTGRCHARNTHVTQTDSSRIFKRIVPVDYSY